MFSIPCPPGSVICHFDKSPTLPIILFELFIIFGTIFSLWYLSRFKERILYRYLIVAVGIFIFEFFTAPMWNNFRLGVWAYVYRDVSWVLTVGWATMILSTIIIVDKLFPRAKEWVRYCYYLIILTYLVLFFESIVVNLGIRSYTPEVLEVVGGWFIPVLNIPLHGFYYVPTFMALVIAFYKYWNLMIDEEPVVPIKKGRWLRNLVIAFIGVFFFELMIEPMVINAKLPAWSYIYRDISIIMSGIWILIIWLATGLVDKLFIHLDLVKKFVLYLITATIVALPLESWFINNGYRIYGPSAVDNFSGFKTIITNIPIEVAFAIPLYLALIISFIKYWEIILDNKK